LSETQVNQICFGSEEPDLTDEYIGAFIEGAQEFYNEVKDLL